MPDIWGIASVIVKFSLYVGVLGAAGTVLAALVLGPVLGRFKGIAAGFAIAGLIASVLAFSLRGAALTGDASGMTDPEMLGLLWQTPVGTALLYRLLGLGLLIAGLIASVTGPWLAVIGGVLAVWSFDHVGHVPDRNLIWLNAALTLHLLGVAFWIGVLIPLRRLALSGGDAAQLGDQFGKVAAIVVPVLLLAGGFLAYDLVGSVRALFGTSYGQALLLKLGLVAGLLVLAAANKLRFVPQINAGDGAASRHLARSIEIEWAVIAAILLITAILTSVLTLPTP
jgi:putative copper resistance protein D